MPFKLIVDTHVHIYPFYAMDRALTAIQKNFNRIDPDAVKVACLTERYDCDVFTVLASDPPASATQKFEIEPSASGNSLEIRSKSSEESFYLLPGQQIITSENLEILSLNCAQRVDEGNPAEQTIRNVNDCGGIAVVAWGLGKWLGKRGKIVDELINGFNPDQFGIGDTTMRPNGWMTPFIMGRARKRGFKILFGSDPLPFIGEEIRPGSYACRMTVPENLHPEEAIRNILSVGIELEPAGRRCSIIEVVNRTLKHRRSSRIAASKISS